MIIALVIVWVLIVAGFWLGWQLLRQNGRLLLRLDGLEKRLNELEFGGQDEPKGLAVGTEAPAFELPGLTGGRQSLAQFHGQPVLLIFFNPDCGFCRELMPKLAAVAAGFQPAVEGGILPPGKKAHPSESLESPKNSPSTQANSAGLPVLRSSTAEGGEARLYGRQGCPPPQILILTTGDPEKNRQFFAEHKVSCPVLLQNDGEVAKAYLVNGTPVGYLVSAEGKVASEMAMGAEALLQLASTNYSQPSTFNSQPDNQSLVLSAATNGNGNGHANRFSQRSVARSKLKRDGLKAGTPAPDFRLPRLDGRGDFTLSELRGKRVLLVFSSPGCGPCNTLGPQLEQFHRKHPEIGVVMVSKGEPKENRAKVKDHGLTFPVLLQQQWEISRRYAMFATPIAYLIDEAGIITHDVAIGAEAILDLAKAAPAASESLLATT